MARKAKPKVDPNAVYVAVESFASAEHGVVTRGSRIRGSLPVVAAHRDFFVEDGSPDREVHDARNSIWAGVQTRTPDVPLKQPSKPLRDEDAVVVIAATGTMGLLLGQRLHKDDKVVKASPAWFAPVCTPGVPRERALVATSTMRTLDADDHEIVAHAGTWVDRDDPFVRLHPEHWALPRHVLRVEDE